MRVSISVLHVLSVYVHSQEKNVFLRAKDLLYFREAYQVAFTCIYMYLKFKADLQTGLDRRPCPLIKSRPSKKKFGRERTDAARQVC